MHSLMPYCPQNNFILWKMTCHQKFLCRLNLLIIEKTLHFYFEGY